MTENNNNLRKEGEFESRVIKHRISRRKKIKREKMDKRFDNIKSMVIKDIKDIYNKIRIGYIALISFGIVIGYTYLILTWVFKMEQEQAITSTIALINHLKL